MQALQKKSNLLNVLFLASNNHNTHFVLTRIWFLMKLTKYIHRHIVILDRFSIKTFTKEKVHSGTSAMVPCHLCRRLRLRLHCLKAAPWTTCPERSCGVSATPWRSTSTRPPREVKESLEKSTCWFILQFRRA